LADFTGITAFCEHQMTNEEDANLLRAQALQQAILRRCSSRGNNLSKGEM
jgi:hypothetical protein